MRMYFTLLTCLFAFSPILTAQTTPDFTLTTTDSEKFSLYEDHLDQGKTVVVEVFFVNCTLCRTLAPYMSTLHKSMVERNIAVEFLSISIIEGDTNEDIAEFKKEFEHDWPFVRRTEESQTVLSNLGGFFGAPTIFVIAPDGTFSKVNGRSSESEEWVQLIEDQIIETQTSFNDTNEEPMNPPPATAIVTGGISTTKGNGLAGVTINFSGGKDTTIVSGEFGTFETGTLLADETYTVALEKNDDVANGVTTLDIVLASKHILGIEEFDQAFQSIAADVNNSGGVTTFDLVLMRQVILGSRTEFPGRPSWIFEPSEVEITSLQELGALAFRATKIGDLNESANPNGLLVGTDRNRSGVLNITALDQEFKAGEQVNVALNGINFRGLQGFQFTFNFDANMLRLNDLNAGNLSDFSVGNINLNFKDSGLFSTSWNGAILNESPTLFELSFTALADGSLSELLSINSDLTTSEGYNADGEILDVQLSFESKATISKSVMSLYPNPTESDELFLTFETPKPQKIKIQLSNISGQSIRNFDFDLAEGAQFLNLDIADLQAGVYLVQILSDQRIIETARLIKH